jgi:hypothetical protein
VSGIKKPSRRRHRSTFDARRRIYWRMWRMRLSVLALASALVGCSGIPFLVPDTRTAADRAGEVEPKCKGFGEETGTPLLSASIVDSVEPAYSHVQSGPVDREAVLRGASLHIKPLPGFSRESLTRNLECHEARVMLGRVAARADDPYVLAGNWLDIDVDSEGDGFVIQVRADSIDVARQVLERAQRFAGVQPHP